MFFVVSKLFSFITDPTFWIVVCFVVSIVLKKRLWKRIAFIFGISLFVLLGNGALISLVEQRWVRNVVKPLPSEIVYEYALIQGGFGDFNSATGRTQVFEEAERLIEPIRLYHSGRVRKLFITGDGSFSNFNKKFPESKQVFLKYLESLGVHGNDIVLDSEARNTRQSALRTKELLGEAFDGKNSLLVTSAIHMPRALKCYCKAGMNPIPYATSVPGPYEMDITNFNIGSNNLYRWQKLIHEWLGLIAYLIAGYV